MLEKAAVQQHIENVAPCSESRRPSSGRLCSRLISSVSLKSPQKSVGPEVRFLCHLVFMSWSPLVFCWKLPEDPSHTCNI